MRPISSCIILGLCVPILACVDRSWRAYGYDHRHFSKQPHEATLNASTAGTLHINWDFSGGTFTASPSVYGNTVYIGGLNGTFYAVWASGTNKGTLRWKYPPAVAPAPADPCGTTTAPLL